MSNLEFAVGKRVVCIRQIKHRPGFGKGDEQLPYKGQVLTIRGVDDYGHIGYLGLLFEEIRNPIRIYGDGRKEVSYAHPNFRPVRETSIDCFTVLLEKPPVKQTETV